MLVFFFFIKMDLSCINLFDLKSWAYLEQESFLLFFDQWSSLTYSGFFSSNIKLYTFNSDVLTFQMFNFLS